MEKSCHQKVRCEWWSKIGRENFHNQSNMKASCFDGVARNSTGGQHKFVISLCNEQHHLRARLHWRSNKHSDIMKTERGKQLFVLQAKEHWVNEGENRARKVSLSSNDRFQVITARKVSIFLSKNVWFFDTSDDDDDGVDAFLSTFILSPKSHKLFAY